MANIVASFKALSLDEMIEAYHRIFISFCWRNRALRSPASRQRFLCTLSHFLAGPTKLPQPKDRRSDAEAIIRATSDC